MNYTIRELSIDERDVLETFLYHAIYIPEGITPPPFEIINQPELQVYIKEFGEQDGDICLVAECDSKIVGAVWVRIMNDYGHVSDDMPSLAISLLPEYRGKSLIYAVQSRGVSVKVELRAQGGGRRLKVSQ